MRIKKPTKKNKSNKTFYLVAVLVTFFVPLCASAVAGYYFLMKDTEKPVVGLAPDASAASLKRPFTVTASNAQSGIRGINVSITQGQRKADVLKKRYDPPKPEVTETFTLEGSELRGGNFEMQVAATDGSYANLGNGNTVRLSKKLLLDPTFPVIKPLTMAHYMRQGGVGLVIFTVNKEPARAGVQAGKVFYPGFALGGGRYGCIFGFPRDVEAEDYKPRILVEDQAGNEKTAMFTNMAIKRRFREERVDIDDAFLAAKLPAFAALYPEVTDPVGRFVKLNRELRRQDEAALAALAAKTASAPLWDGVFIYLPGSVVKGSFGADRVYTYKGQEIDRERHMGIDLASVKNAVVPAANNGRVVFAGPLGLYGNAVVIDHGLGVQTLYGHLSTMDVKVGATVKKGEAIGRTGATGLAAGDHLHFGVLLSGHEVIPIEWWDAHWLDDNITQKFKRFGENPQ